MKLFKYGFKNFTFLDHKDFSVSNIPGDISPVRVSAFDDNDTSVDLLVYGTDEGDATVIAIVLDGVVAGMKVLDGFQESYADLANEMAKKLQDAYDLDEYVSDMIYEYQIVD